MQRTAPKAYNTVQNADRLPAAYSADKDD